MHYAVYIRPGIGF